MAQGIWSGTISFSLVAIPVQLVKAIEPGRISFRLLHSEDYSPLARRMICPEQDTMVPPEEIVRGYEIGPDRYLTITDEELESVTPERSRTIEIVEFIDLQEVDSIYFDHPYYLVPLKGGEKSYRLLAEVMRRNNRAGLARFVLAEREYLVAVRSIEGALSLTTLHYSDEILPAEEISPQTDLMDIGVKDSMKKCIKQMLREFEPGKYADQRREKVLELIKRKMLEQKPVEAPHPGEEEGEGPVDLVVALEEIMRNMKEQH